MSATKRRLCIALVSLLMTAGVLRPMFHSVTITTASVSWLSPAELNRLERQVAVEKNARAAYRIFHYYERNKHDVALQFLWLQRAVDLGNESAQQQLESVENADPEICAEINAWIEKGRKKEEAGGS